MKDPFDQLNLAEETRPEQCTEKIARSTPLPTVIATSSVYTDDAALDWLKGYGATTEYAAGITLVTLPEQAQVDKGAFAWQYTIGFITQEDSDETYVEVELSIDANETVLRFHPDASSEVDTEVLSTAPIIPNFE